MDENIAGRIDRYRPMGTRRVALGEPGLALVRRAVLAAKPQATAETDRLLTHSSSHVIWAQRAGEGLDLARVFSVEVVEASIAAAREAADGGSVSPYAVNLRRVARAAAPKGGHVPSLALPPTLVKAPYSDQERTALLAASKGLAADARGSYLGGLALGFGCGLVGPEASAVDADDLVEAGGQLWVAVAGGPSGFLPVTGRWADVLRGLGLGSRGGPVTEAYTLAGSQRRKRLEKRAVGVPAYDSARLRSSWICDLLAGGVPVDVIAMGARVAPWTVAHYLVHVSPAAPAELRSWFSTDADARPPLGVMPVRVGDAGELVAVGRAIGIGTVEQVLERFCPADAAAAEAWVASIGKEMRDLIRASTIEGGRARNLAAAASVLLAWAARQPGMPLRAEVVLKESTITRFAAAALRHGDVADGSVWSYRSLLRALAEAGGFRAPAPTRARPAPARPYSDREQQALAGREAQLSSGDRRILDAYVALGLGAGGAGEEVPAITAAEIVDDPDGDDPDGRAVQFTGRLVPVRPDFAGLVAELAASGAGRPLTGIDSPWTTRQRARISQAVGIEVAPARLRATWLVHHLQRGVPLHVLTAAAGARLSQLNSLVAELAPREPADVLAWLAAGRTTTPGSAQVRPAL
ncbi:MAG: hypothetical protein ABIS21_00825 [Acidimicrobiales bacterium]